jgi:HD-GYP domain-containing protein (c-di-GMP phosphodiesterase class II)
MADARRLSSIFSQKLDRSAFTAYFLGAVVPLVALAVVVERFVLPRLHDRLALLGLSGAVVSIAVLSLASFLTLRATTRRSIATMDRDNQRLGSLLQVSGSLARAEHAEMAALSACVCAVDLTGARAAWVILRGDPGQPLQVLDAAGRDAAKLRDALHEHIDELAKLVMSQGRPGVQGAVEVPSAEGSLAFSAAAAPIPGEGAPLGALVAVHCDPEASFEAAELQALATLGGLASVALHNAELKDTQRNFFTHVTDILVHALDAHLNYHSGHGERVAQYANRLGRELGLPEPRLQRLHFASLLHDIGMLKLDRDQQMNPRTCARHTVLGFRMLDRIRLWKDIAPVVHHHHEWWDGSGYPEGLSGDAIPLEARIVALADAFDSITSATSYKSARSIDEAIHEIRAGAGTQFDPGVVSAFDRLVAAGAMDIAHSG